MTNIWLALTTRSFGVPFQKSKEIFSLVVQSKHITAIVEKPEGCHLFTVNGDFQVLESYKTVLDMLGMNLSQES